MGGPFRFNKKTRKRLTLRKKSSRIAQAKARKKKKPKSPK
jgi:hypothetical protein